MVNTISVRELRPKLSKILKRMHKQFDRYIITKRGKPEAVLMSVDDYESLIETLDIQSDKELMKRLKKADEEIKAGKGKPFEQVMAGLKVV